MDSLKLESSNKNATCSFSLKAVQYLHEMDEDFFRDIAESGLVGILQDAVTCQEAFPACFETELNSYRHPGVGPEAAYHHQLHAKFMQIQQNLLIKS